MRCGHTKVHNPAQSALIRYQIALNFLYEWPTIRDIYLKRGWVG